MKLNTLKLSTINITQTFVNTSTHAHLYFGVGKFLMIAPHISNDMHRHSVIQITLSLEHPFSVRIENGNWHTCYSVVIDSNIYHQLKDLEGIQASFAFVPNSSRAKLLRNFILGRNRMRIIDHLDVSPYINKFKNFYTKPNDCKSAFKICDELVNTITGTFQNDNHSVDHRIGTVMNFIQHNIDRSISAHELAQLIFLSDDRFLHLFKEQLGIPLRQYILYQRIMAATKEFMNGKSLTQAAIASGFSDSAHLTRTFVTMNGLRPSDLRKFGFTFSTTFCSDPLL